MMEQDPFKVDMVWDSAPNYARCIRDFGAGRLRADAEFRAHFAVFELTESFLPGTPAEASPGSWFLCAFDESYGHWVMVKRGGCIDWPLLKDQIADIDSLMLDDLLGPAAKY
jgi:hypothetical protein